MSTYFTSEVIVISEEGKNLGRMPAGKARALAKEQGLDLVEVSKQDGFSLCKIMDEGKWLYEQKKKKKAQTHHHSHLKEMQFRIRIDTHDFNTKIEHIRRFIEKGHDVRVVVVLKGREKAHPEAAHQKMQQILESFNGQVKVDAVKRGGDSLTTTLHPAKRGHDVGTEKVTSADSDGRVRSEQQGHS